MGAHRDNFDSNRGIRRFGGRFFLNGASAFPTLATGTAATFPVGNDFTATRTGVGLATIKINVVASGCLNFRAYLKKSAVAALYMHELGYTQGTDGMWTLSLRQTTFDGTTPAEWSAANAANFIDFDAALLVGDRTF